MAATKKWNLQTQKIIISCKRSRLKGIFIEIIAIRTAENVYLPDVLGGQGLEVLQLLQPAAEVSPHVHVAPGDGDGAPEDGPEQQQRDQQD
jgi:hypothetical protein